MKRLYPKKILYVLYTFSCRFAHRYTQILKISALLKL